MRDFSSSDFVVAEQLSGAYVQHTFRDREQFVNWRKVHPGLKIIHRRSARGRKLPGYDHRYEYWD